jgi:hypothetical protein
VDRLVLDDFDGLLAMGCEDRTKALLLDDFAESFPDSPIVVGDEDRIWLIGNRHVRLPHSARPFRIGFEAVSPHGSTLYLFISIVECQR